MLSCGENENKYSNAQTQNKCKLSLANRHLAKMINHWHTIDSLILDFDFLISNAS